MKQPEQPEIMNAAHPMNTPFGEVMVPLIVLSALQGGAPMPALVQLWQKVWRPDFPGMLAAMFVLHTAEINRVENERIASLN